jgi:hypothetical protein
VEVTDPTEPLFGKRFLIELISRRTEEDAQVFLRREDGVVLRVRLRATNLSALVDQAPRARLCRPAVAEFLGLVKEYGLWSQTKKPSKSGRRSTSRRDRKS